MKIFISFLGLLLLICTCNKGKEQTVKKRPTVVDTYEEDTTDYTVYNPQHSHRITKQSHALRKLLIETLAQKHPEYNLNTVNLFQDYHAKAPHTLYITKVWDEHMNTDDEKDMVVSFFIRTNDNIQYNDDLDTDTIPVLDQIGWAVVLNNTQQPTLPAIQLFGSRWDAGERIKSVQKGTFTTWYLEPSPGGDHTCDCRERKRVYAYQNNAIKLISETKPKKVLHTEYGGRNDLSDTLNFKEALHAVFKANGYACKTVINQKPTTRFPEEDYMSDTDIEAEQCIRIELLFAEKVNLDNDKHPDYIIGYNERSCLDPSGMAFICITRGPKNKLRFIKNKLYASSSSEGNFDYFEKVMDDGTIITAFSEDIDQKNGNYINRNGSRHYVLRGDSLLMVKELLNELDP